MCLQGHGQVRTRLSLGAAGAAEPPQPLRLDNGPRGDARRRRKHFFLQGHPTRLWGRRRGHLPPAAAQRLPGKCSTPKQRFTWAFLKTLKCSLAPPLLQL